MAANGQVRIRFETDDRDEATAFEAQLRAVEASDIEVTEEAKEGIVPIVLIVVAAVLGVTALVDLIERRRRKHMCQEILDCRGEEIHPITNCARRDGSIIVLTKDDQKVEITQVPDGVDITEIVKAAISAGAEAVKAAADAAGAKATEPTPASQEPTPVATR